jgi:hypothetical protein
VFIEGAEFKIAHSILNLKDTYIVKLVEFSHKISKIIDTYFTVVNEIFMPKHLKDGKMKPEGLTFMYKESEDIKQILG